MENKTVAQVISKKGNEEIENNIDKVLKDVKKVDETCTYSKCREKTNLMGEICQFCKNKYCYKHSLPEIHGKFTKCDELVRKKEREEFLHPKIDTRKVAHQVEHDKAKKTLEIKLKQMQLERKAKPSTSGKKKK